MVWDRFMLGASSAVWGGSEVWAVGQQGWSAEGGSAAGRVTTVSTVTTSVCQLPSVTALGMHTASKAVYTEGVPEPGFVQ